MDLLAHFGIPLLFLLLMWGLHPFHRVFEFDPDEGNEVIKALMIAKGHALYTETWSDQPPLFSYLLRGWFALTDWTVHQGRIFVLLCAAVLLWAFYQTIRLTWGHAAALAGAFTLALSWRYMALSVAVMQALPTLMFAMLSIYAVARFARAPHVGWAAASGVLLMLSLFTKPFTLPVAPLILIALIHVAWRRGEPAGARRWLVPALAWCGGAVAAGALVIVLTVPLSGFRQFIEPHLAAQETMAQQGFDQVFRDMVKADYAFALLGVCGLLQILRRREWSSLLAVVWCVFSYYLLWTHRPLWYHHYPLLAVPMCWLAGIGLGALFDRSLWRTCRPWSGVRSAYATVALLLTFGLGVLAASTVPAAFKRESDYANIYVQMTPGDWYTVAVLKQFKDRTPCVVTDRQMLAFSAGLAVPPELSVTSVKRMRSGNLTPATLVGLLQRYEPGVIHLSWRDRIRMTPELSEYLKTQYTRLYADPRGDRVYVRNPLAADPVGVLQRAAAEVPQAGEGHYNLGVTLAEAGRDAEAARELEASVKVRPTLPAYRAWGGVLKRLGRLADAAAVYEALGTNLRAQKHENEAAQALEEADRLRAAAGGRTK